MEKEDLKANRANSPDNPPIHDPALKAQCPWMKSECILSNCAVYDDFNGVCGVFGVVQELYKLNETIKLIRVEMKS